MRALYLGLLASLSLPSFAFADCANDPHRATRDWLQAVLAARAQGSLPTFTPDQWKRLREAAKRTHLSAGSSARLPITRAPYFPAVLLSQYPRIYATELAKAIQQYQANPPLDGIFDGVLEKIRAYQAMSSSAQAAYRAQGGQNAQIASTADTMGTCLANNAAKGAQDASCQLDLSDNENVPTVVYQAYVRGTCTEGGFFDSWTPCQYRQFVYDSAKPQLKPLRKDPAVLAQVAEKVKAGFAAQFPQKLLGAEGQQQQAAFNNLVAAKWGAGGAGSALWTAQGSLLTEDAVGEVCLADFAQAAAIDVELARVARESFPDAESSADASAFFYSAVNRFFLLNGGAELALNAGASVALPGSPAQDLFGGFGGSAAGYGAWIFDPAESGAYDPSGALAKTKARAHQKKYGGWLVVEGPTPLRVFPETFRVGARGEILAGATIAPGAQTESLSDLARLVRASVLLLRASRDTAPEADGSGRGALAPFFGTESELSSGLLSASSPRIFPVDQGRGSAMGILSGALQNLSLPSRGHVQLVDMLDEQAGDAFGGPSMGIFTHDRIRLDGPVRAPMRAESVIALIGSVSDLLADLRSAGGGQDPIYPDAFRQAAQGLPDAVGLLAMNLISLAQTPDGSFRDELVLGDPAIPARISTTLRALDALSRVPQPEKLLPWADALRAGWRFIEANRAQVDALADLDPALPIVALTAWDRAQARLNLAQIAPAAAAWIEAKRSGFGSSF